MVEWLSTSEDVQPTSIRKASSVQSVLPWVSDGCRFFVVAYKAGLKIPKYVQSNTLDFGSEFCTQRQQQKKHKSAKIVKTALLLKRPFFGEKAPDITQPPKIRWVYICNFSCDGVPLFIILYSLIFVQQLHNFLWSAHNDLFCFVHGRKKISLIGALRPKCGG